MKLRPEYLEHAERILKAALKANLAAAVVVGRTRDGETYGAASTKEVGEVLQLIEGFKVRLLIQND